MLHENRERAESFGSDAALYDRVRPSYPSELIDAILTAGVRDVLDVGCGTGLAAAALAARGARVLGVEIDERMAEVARGRGIAVEVARFEDWDDRDRRFDLVTSGQAWHWVQPGHGAAAAARVLRPGGRIAIFWNLGDPSPAARERLAPIYEELEPDLVNYSVVLDSSSHRDRDAVDGLAGSGRFGEITVRRFPWTRSYDSATWVAFLRTHSDHSTLPRERRERLLGAVAEAIDGLGGTFEVAYQAVLVTAPVRE